MLHVSARLACEIGDAFARPGAAAEVPKETRWGEKLTGQYERSCITIKILDVDMPRSDVHKGRLVEHSSSAAAAGFDIGQAVQTHKAGAGAAAATSALLHTAAERLLHISTSPNCQGPGDPSAPPMSSGSTRNNTRRPDGRAA